VKSLISFDQYACAFSNCANKRQLCKLFCMWFAWISSSVYCWNKYSSDFTFYSKWTITNFSHLKWLRIICFYGDVCVYVCVCPSVFKAASDVRQQITRSPFCTSTVTHTQWQETLLCLLVWTRCHSFPCHQQTTRYTKGKCLREALLSLWPSEDHTHTHTHTHTQESLLMGPFSLSLLG